MSDECELSGYYHRPIEGELLWADGAWSWPRAQARVNSIHPAYEIGVVLEGKECFSFEDGAELVCEPGEVWLCRAWEPHVWQVPEGGVRAIVLHFREGFLGDTDIGLGSWREVFEVSPEHRPRISDHHLRSHFRAIGEHIANESTAKYKAWKGLIRLDLLHLLTELARHWEAPQERDQNTYEIVSRLPSKLPERLMPALVLARSKGDFRVNIKKAAETCGLSKSHFQAEFRSATGMSFGRYCLQRRLAVAAHLLVSTNRTIASVAQQTGFWDDSHFHRLFCREYGQRPTDYRRTHKH